MKMDQTFQLLHEDQIDRLRIIHFDLQWIYGLLVVQAVLLFLIFATLR